MALRYPILSEKAVGLVENENKIVFFVDGNSTKPDIKKAVEELYKVKVADVNTMVTPDGDKKAYVRLKKEFKATDLATKLKIIYVVDYGQAVDDATSW
jgi:large subunit ribosomal protein L23